MKMMNTDENEIKMHVNATSLRLLPSAITGVHLIFYLWQHSFLVLSSERSLV
jgi:hypothetical protein